MEVKNPKAAYFAYNLNAVTAKFLADFMKWCYANKVTIDFYDEVGYKKIIERYVTDESARPSGDYMKQLDCGHYWIKGNTPNFWKCKKCGKEEIRQC